MKNRLDSGIGSGISRSILKRFLVTLAVFLAVVCAIWAVAGLILRQFIWQPYDPLYIVFKSLESNFFELIVLFGLLGFVVIFSHYWSKTVGFIETIVEASEALVEPGEDLIHLPAELRQVETRMNQAKQDVSRSARMAREAEQRKNDLIMYLAHDIKTPLTSVVGYLSLLDEAPDMPPEQKAKYVRITLDKANRLEQLIDEFFEITRYNLHTINLYKEKIDLYYMLAQMTDEFYPQLVAARKGAELDAPEDIVVYGDADKLARVFNNILKNAVAYSDEESVIRIIARQTVDAVTIEFHNVGSIPRDKLASIFERFYRLDDARSSEHGGSGLGLAIAKEIVELHGGQIHASSDGGKTVFTVALPR